MSKNFTLAEIVLILLLAGGCVGQNFNFLSDYDGQGTPLDMVNTPVSESLSDNISASLPEGFPVPDYNPQYISDGIQTDVVLNELADVWVTFIAEGAGYRNVLGFYTYDINDPLSSAPDDEDITIIFPNVSAQGSGGGLIKGDKMYLGQYPANTGIGWVLIANGWNGNSVTYGNWVLYSNPDFNPESDPEDRKHNVNLFDSNEEVVVFGFEDIRRDYGSCDQDFNDALFLVTTNPYVAMETSNYNPLVTDGGEQSSGNDGGLESNRGLSQKIAKRNYARKSKTAPSVSDDVRKRNNSILQEIIPESVFENDEKIIATPLDLLDITAANKVFAVDYYQDDKCSASIFATQTEGKIYDHTKPVCDRLAGSKLNSIRNVSIDNMKFLLSELETEEGNIEYSISFSIAEIEELGFRVFSRWAVDQYPQAKVFYSFQVWSAAPFSTIDMVRKMLSHTDEIFEATVIQEESNYLPKCYISRGDYQNNQINLTIVNTTTNSLETNLIGSFTEYENDEELDLLMKTVNLNPGENQIAIENYGGSFFDLEIKVKPTTESTYDVGYFSDGAWGMDYDSERTKIEDVEYSLNDGDVGTSDYYVRRDIKVDFNSSDYLSIFKHLRPAGQSEDLSGYNALKFDLDWNGKIEVRLFKESSSNWADQYVFTLNLEEGLNQVVIPFADFKNSSGEAMTAEDISMIVFTITGADGNDQIEIQNVHFTNVDNTSSLTANSSLFYPNPSDGLLKGYIELEKEESFTVSVQDIGGRVMLTRTFDGALGVNLFSLDISNFVSGAYFISIRSENTIITEKVIKE